MVDNSPTEHLNEFKLTHRLKRNTMAQDPGGPTADRHIQKPDRSLTK